MRVLTKIAMRRTFRHAFVRGMFLLITSCAPATATRLPPTPTPSPALIARGAQAYAQHCAACHGPNGQGTPQGPPLVHKIYEPSHHADIAFVIAAQNGVKAHHWGFGDMPAQPHVPLDDVRAIIQHVRALQRAAGIQ